MNSFTAPEQLNLNLVVDKVDAIIPRINVRAVTVKLAISRPRTRTRNEAGEQILRDETGDAANTVSTEQFKDRTNPIRVILNKVAELYRNHNKLTFADPHEKRGSRTLFTSILDIYKSEQRAIETEIADLINKYMPHYDAHVQQDIAARLAPRMGATHDGRGRPYPPITADQYLTREDFESRLTFEHKWGTLPDKRHPIFDLDDDQMNEIKRSLSEELDAREAALSSSIRSETVDRIRDPLIKMLDKLRIPQGEPGSIFRDTLVENLHDNVRFVRQMDLGDPQIDALLDEVEKATTGHARNPQVLRDSPIVREQTVAKLEAVASKMAFMFGTPQ